MKKLHFFSIVGILLFNFTLFSMEGHKRASSFQDLKKESDKELCHVLQKQHSGLTVELRLREDRLNKRFETLIALNQSFDDRLQTIEEILAALMAQTKKNYSSIQKLGAAQATCLFPEFERLQSSPRRDIPLGQSPRTPRKNRTSKPPIPTSALGNSQEKDAFAKWAEYSSDKDASPSAIERSVSDKNNPGGKIAPDKKNNREGRRKNKGKRQNDINDIHVYMLRSAGSIPTKPKVSPRFSNEKKKKKKHRKKNPRTKQVAIKAS